MTKGEQTMQIFYITFCWDRRLLYDGYIIRKDNDKIYGCTDENVIIGDKKGVKEIQKDGMIIRYNISKNIFSKYEHEDGFQVKFSYGEQKVKVDLQMVQNVKKERIIARIQKVLTDYPEELREILEEDCLGEE